MIPSEQDVDRLKHVYSGPDNAVLAFIMVVVCSSYVGEYLGECMIINYFDPWGVEALERLQPRADSCACNSGGKP